MRIKLLLLGVFLFSGILSTFADDSISTTLSKNEVQVGESFQLDISLDTADIQGEIAVSIPGIEKFDVFSQQQSYSYSNVNGKNTTQLHYILQMSTQEAGKYSLGPVSLVSSGSTLSSDAPLEIEVGGTKTGNSASTGNIIGTQNQILSNNLQNTPTKKELTDDIKDIKRASFPLWVIFVGILGFLGIFFLVLRYFIEKKNTPSAPIIESPMIQEDTTQKHIKYFESLRREIDIRSGQEFFKKYNLGLRNLLQESTSQDIMTSTLFELRKNKDIGEKVMFQAFQRGYMHEYGTQEVSREEKEKSIQTVLDYLK